MGHGTGRYCHQKADLDIFSGHYLSGREILVDHFKCFIVPPFDEWFNLGPFTSVSPPRVQPPPRPATSATAAADDGALPSDVPPTAALSPSSLREPLSELPCLQLRGDEKRRDLDRRAIAAQYLSSRDHLISCGRDGPQWGWVHYSGFQQTFHGPLIVLLYFVVWVGGAT
jgi:hypothetical protein